MKVCSTWTWLTRRSEQLSARPGLSQGEKRRKRQKTGLGSPTCGHEDRAEVLRRQMDERQFPREDAHADQAQGQAQRFL